ncbi:peptidase [Jannaschia sp. 2305UL9-9]|uniref:peptidase n=1 Tax=Jannaschia sp. 2305UL9-9 TaxID=3121638 RepID=UPI00352894AF
MLRRSDPFADRLVIWLAAREQAFKWFALILGIASTVAIVQNWHPWPMVFGLPFCVIWIFYAWLHTERQLKYVNLLFTALYVYGLIRWVLLEG